MAKATQAEVQRRIDVVYKMLIELKPRSFIVRHCADEWGVSSRQTDTYIARAREVIRTDADVERTDWLATRLQIIDDAIRAAAKGGVNSQSNLIGLIKLEADLTGSYPQVK